MLLLPTFFPQNEYFSIYILYSEKTEFGTDELAKSLNVSSMTILRAMEELKHLNIIKQGIAGKTGRKKLYAPIEKKNYYRIGKESIWSIR